MLKILGFLRHLYSTFKTVGYSSQKGVMLLLVLFAAGLLAYASSHSEEALKALYVVVSVIFGLPH